MKCHFSLAALGLLVTACSSSPDTRLLGVADLPLKSTTMPEFSVMSAPIRANARYITYDAKTGKERKLKIGDYYFVRWYDAHPEEPVRLVMHYTQAATGATKLRSELRIDEPRKGPDVMLTPIFFTGEDRAKKGDVMTWKIELYSGGKLKDTRSSYLWRDTPATPVVPPEPASGEDSGEDPPTQSGAQPGAAAAPTQAPQHTEPAPQLTPPEETQPAKTEPEETADSARQAD